MKIRHIVIGLLVMISGLNAQTNQKVTNAWLYGNGNITPNRVFTMQFLTSPLLGGYIYNGDPNGVIPASKGSICYDYSNGWHWVSQGGTVWYKNVTSNDAWLLNGNSLSTTKNIGTVTNFALPFITNNIERARITTGGDFGIKTTTPQNTLHIGAATVTGTGGVRLPITSGSTPTASTAYLGVDVNGDIVRAANPAGGGGGITDINGLTAASQTLAVSYGGSLSGVSFTETSAGSSHVISLTLPAISTTDQNGLTNVGTALQPENELGGTLLHATTITNNAFDLSIQGGTITTTFKDDGKVGINASAPNSDLQVSGSVAFGITTMTATGTVPNTVYKVIAANGATNVTFTLPSPVGRAGRVISITRAAGSIGTITVLPGAGLIQALAGTLGATTTIAGHGAAGQGLNINFWSDGTNWYR